MGKWLFCPEFLDIDLEIKKNLIPKGKGIHRDNLLYIIHCLMIRKAYLSKDHLKKLGKAAGFIPLNAKYLEGKISRYRNNLEYLIKIGIIESDESYLSNKVSKGYRLTAPFTGQGFKKVEITYSPLCRKLKRESSFKKDRIAIKEFPYLAQWFQTGKLEIDIKRAINWIDVSEKQDLINLVNNFSLNANKIAEESDKIRDKYSGYKILATRLSEKSYYFHKDEFGNRLHTNLTNLPKGLRNFLSYDGEKLVSIDIKNSQPYMSLPMLTADFWQSKPLPGKPTLKMIDEEIYKDRKWERYKRRVIIMFNNFSEILASGDFQTSEFIRNVINGTFYEYLVSVFESNGSIDLGVTNSEKREKVKKMVLTLLFDNEVKAYNKEENSASQQFRKEFKAVSRILRLVKEGGHRTLAKLLQKIESSLILGRICKRINKENPSVPLFTIHDSIVTTTEHKDFVQVIMKEELIKAIGAAPKFSIEDWQEQVLGSVEAA